MLVIPAAPQRAAHRPRWCEREERPLCSPGAGRGQALAEWDLKPGAGLKLVPLDQCLEASRPFSPAHVPYAPSPHS